MADTKATIAQHADAFLAAMAELPEAEQWRLYDLAVSLRNELRAQVDSKVIQLPAHRTRQRRV
jgi:hypothetical protein